MRRNKSIKMENADAEKRDAFDAVYGKGDERKILKIQSDLDNKHRKKLTKRKQERTE
mgnify:CR=1 FL=1